MRRIAWMLPSFADGSGGGRTILQNIDFLEKNGYKCDIYVDPKADIKAFGETIQNYGFDFKGKLYSGYDSKEKYDMAIATYYATAKEVAKTDCAYKLYFMQDYEPWFFPMSINYLDAEDSYKYGLRGVTIGRWLTRKMQEEFGMESQYFDFCVDNSVYHPLENIKREKAICFVFQPEKPRRMVDVGLKALQIVQQNNPSVKIYLYGSRKMPLHNIEAEHLGLITPEECNNLYNKCRVGLCLSATNPSRIPFEMMATGLPVVEMYGDNTIYDYPDEGCLLSERNPSSIARAIETLLNEDDKWQKLHKDGYEYMQNYPLEKGFKEFEEIIDACFANKIIRNDVDDSRYKKKAVTEKDSENLETEDVFFTPSGSALRRKLAKIKYALSEG